MVIISAAAAANGGQVRIQEAPGSDMETLRPRVTRTATLDGGVVITHQGWSDGDRTLQIVARDMSLDDRDTLRTMVQNQTEFVLSCRHGCYRGAIDSARLDRDPVRIIFIVKEAES